MARGQLVAVLRRLCLIHEKKAGDASDRHLLERFIASKDEVAFAALLERHGRLVFGVCRAVLHQEQDAEDAFQATFLVLARMAASINKRDSLTSWLHGVALRTALKARRAMATRHRQERQAPKRTPEQPVTEAALRELESILHQEIGRVPANYLAPFVLCCLEGKSRADAAVQLDLPEGTVSGRIAKARALLENRLARQGITFSAALGAAVAIGSNASAATPGVLSAIVIRAAVAFAAGNACDMVSGEAIILADGVILAMLMSKVKVVTSVLLAVVLAFGGAGLLYSAWLPQPGDPPQRAAQSKPDENQAPNPNRDDPLATKESKLALHVVAEPFLFKGSYYLKLSLENRGDKPVTIHGQYEPAWTLAKTFTIFADGKELTDPLPRGNYSISDDSEQTKELPAKGRLFYGLTILAGKDKARVQDSFSPQFDLAAGDHEIEVHACNVTKPVFDGGGSGTDKNVTPAKLKVSIPANLASAADQGVPNTKKPLHFTLATHQADPGMVHINIHVANESTDLWHFPYKGDTPPWHRANWYLLEVDGKIVKPFRNGSEQEDGDDGKPEILRMHTWYAHTFKIVSENTRNRKFGTQDYHPAYVLPPGQHTIRVIPSDLWAQKQTPMPTPASTRIRLEPARK